MKYNNSFIINKSNKEKLRVSSLLCILADGTKLIPYLIFKGKNNSPILKSELNQNEYVKN